MWRPYYRGNETWKQRLQAVDYLKKVEFMDQVYHPFDSLENGLDLTVPQLTRRYVASDGWLCMVYPKRFDAKNRWIRSRFSQLQSLIRKDPLHPIHHLSAEFDFSISLYIDHLASQHLSMSALDRQNDPVKEDSKLFIYLQSGYDLYQRGQFPEAMKALHQAELEGDLPYPALYCLGLLLFNGYTLLNEKEALAHFSLAKEKALLYGDEPFAARCQMHAAFTLYLMTQDNEALERAQDAIAMDPSLAVAYYVYAKLASLSDRELALRSIKHAIQLDRRFALLVGADADFDTIREQLFVEQYRQARDRTVSVYERDKQKAKILSHILRQIKELGSSISNAESHMDVLENKRKAIEPYQHEWEKLSDIFMRDTWFDYEYYSRARKPFEHLFQQESQEKKIQRLFHVVLSIHQRKQKLKLLFERLYHRTILIKTSSLILLILTVIIAARMAEHDWSQILFLNGIVFLVYLTREVWKFLQSRKTESMPLTLHQLNAALTQRIRQHLNWLWVLAGFNTLVLLFLMNAMLEVDAIQPHWKGIAVGLISLAINYVLIYPFRMLRRRQKQVVDDMRRMEREFEKLIQED